MWEVRYLADAERELDTLPSAEISAMRNAEVKLQALGPALGYPHTSDVRGAGRLRELRPRQGRSPWRALYAQHGQVFLIAAICPEAQQSPRGFRRGCAAALQRLAREE